MNEQQKKWFESAWDIDDIPNMLLFELYDGMDFDKEYFWCSCEEDV